MRRERKGKGKKRGENVRGGKGRIKGKREEGREG